MSKRTLIARSFAIGTLAFAATSFAQSNPPKPNVLLLVDTSGSMEWKSSAAGCQSGRCFPTCKPDQPNDGVSNPNEKSRWTDLLEVMTGSIQKYSCFAQQRSSSTFIQEYQLGSSPPYDRTFENPYNRPLSNLCAPAAGVLPPISNPYQFPTGAIAYRPYDIGSQNISLSSTCTYGQYRDGLLDAYDGYIRFGLMTFDTSPDPGTGVSLAGGADYATGMTGAWSYYLTGTGACKNSSPGGGCLGAPWNCGALYNQEVGARNAAAPPWEGRMVAFGPPTEDGTVRNQWIQETLLATRPYGATPIAGMLADAKNFLWNDQSLDPLNPTERFGPMDDPLIDSTPDSDQTANCRQEYIILLTDGEPNQDLRDANCVNPNNLSDATCPYDTSAKIARDLANPSDPRKTVRTFVVGFAIGNVKQFTPDGGSQTIDCETMDLNLCTPMPTDRQLKACCVLNEIAWEGTPQVLQGKKGEIDHALFPSSAADLRAAISKIITKMSNKVDGRTFPSTASAGRVEAAGVMGYEFDTGAEPARGWRGMLRRRRLVCETGAAEAVPQEIKDSAGDDFVATLNKYPTDRTFFTVVGDAVSSVRYPQNSIRPFYSATINDGVGTYSGAQTAYVAPTGLAPVVPPEAMGVSDTSCDSATEDLTKNQCRDRVLNWAVAVPTGSTTLPNRCATPGTDDCNVFGDIFHSQPQLRGKPSDLLPDDTYTGFVNAMATRDSLLYVSTNDGFLHAFLVAPGDPNNTSEIVDRQRAHQERWAFIPPAVLPYFLSMYPGNFTVPGQTVPNSTTRMPVLDGTAVLKDVGATQLGGSSGAYPYRLDRKKLADVVAQESQTWRTILLEGFGPLQSGFFAVDVTKPAIVTGDATSGPKFLWQLTTDDASNHLFGKTSPNPLITTLFFNTGESSEPIREVAVAVLAGGDGDAPTSADCDAGPLMPQFDTTTTPRTRVRCYNSGRSIPARSLTIVRLDTGAIVRTFRPNLPTGLAQPVTFDSNLVQLQEIPSPIVGQPVAFPGQTGQIADRIFVGDKDGRVWRIDVSDTDPKKWTMQVYFDAYFDKGFDEGQPIQTPPVLSVDEQGWITVAFATGDQDNIVPATITNHVYSTTEAVVSAGGVSTFKPKVNWRTSYENGERAMGPLTLFARILYYSTVRPPIPTSTSRCADLSSKSIIHGWDFLQSLPSSALPRPAARDKDPPHALNPNADYDELDRQGIGHPDISGIVAGVGLRQLPSCSTVSDATTNQDAFLGYGMSSVIGTSAPGKFQLVFQPGGGKTTTNSSGKTEAPVTTMNLQPPNTTVRVDSWAPIVQ